MGIVACRGLAFDDRSTATVSSSINRSSEIFFKFAGSTRPRRIVEINGALRVEIGVSKSKRRFPTFDFLERPSRGKV